MFLEKPSKWASKLGVRRQLVLLFVAVFGVFFAAFSVSVSIYIARTHQREFDSALYNYVIDVSHSVDLTSLKKGSFLADTEMILPFSLGETLLQIIDANERVILRSKSLGTRSLPLPAKMRKDDLFKTRALYEDVRMQGSRYRMVSHVARRPDVGTIIVQAAVPMILLDRQEEALITYFTIAVPLILLLAAFFGLAFSRRAMRPISMMIARANEIEAQHLSEGIPVPENRDEIRDLAVTLNGLLQRLHKAFQSQEGFVADASHQLKTPLSILKGELEIFQKSEKTPAEIETFIQSARQEIDYLAKMVEDLLLLARMDAAGGKLANHPMQLDEKLLECVARFERASKHKGIRFKVDLDVPHLEDSNASFVIDGEPELVRSLIESLLDNAVKYSPEGGLVRVSLVDRGMFLALAVEDSGPGIPDSVMPMLFKRFYRSESTRDVISGSGLGLPIVERIAHLHGGTVSASNREGGVGACLRVCLPRSRPAAHA